MSGDTDPRNLLSAHLDGELTDDEEARVQELLDADPDARAELAGLAAVRSRLRSLAEVDVPDGFFEGLLANGLDPVLRTEPPVEADPPAQGSVAPVAQVASLDDRRRNRGRLYAAVAAVAAVAAAFLLVLPMVSSTGDSSVVPPVSEFASRHGAAAADLTSIIGSSGGFVQLADDELDEMGDAAPAEVAGEWERAVGFLHESGAVHLMYANDDEMVSVFEQAGTVDWAQLPPGGQRVSLDGDEAWSMPTDAGEVMVVQRNDMTLTFVSAAPIDDMLRVVQSIPA